MGEDEVESHGVSKFFICFSLSLSLSDGNIELAGDHIEGEEERMTIREERKINFLGIILPFFHISDMVVSGK